MNTINSFISTFKYDCEKLFSSYRKLQTFDYSSFVNIWKDINFKLTNKIDQTDDERKCIREKMIYNTKIYLANAKCVYSQVAAIYLLYALVYNQHHKDDIKIRLTLTDFKIVKTLVQNMQECKQLDFLYIFAKMKNENVFEYVVTDCEMTLEGGHNKLVKQRNEGIATSTLSSMVNDLINKSTVVANLKKTQKTYEQYLKEYLDEHPEITFTLNKSSVVTELKRVNEKI